MKKSNLFPYLIWQMLGVVAAAIFAAPSRALALHFDVTGNPALNEVLATIFYSAMGLILALISFRVIDQLTPGSLSEEIAKNNIAMGVLVGCTILGVCIIIAAAIAG